MPVKAFEVIVGVPADTEMLAIAEASRYLAYADQTDTFGYSGRVFDVNVYGSDGERDWGIGLQFRCRITGDDELKAFMDEMTTLAQVESVERVSYEVE